jgi:phosphoesterase RecJ-like protein
MRKVSSTFNFSQEEIRTFAAQFNDNMLTKIIEQSKIDRFSKWLESADKIVIVAHVMPDGDAIGSSLALWHFLNNQDREVNVIVPNAFPDFLKWMNGSKEILNYMRYKEFADRLIAEAEVICCLDFNTPKRLETLADAVLAAPARKIMIDHHPDPSDFCQITISHPEISSTSELIFRLICRMGYFGDITKEAAECIYTGMMTDTGGFTFNSNSREIYFIISELLSKGIDKDAIYRKVYNTYSEWRLRLMGHILSQMKVYPEHRTAVIMLTGEEQSRFRYIKGDSEGFVNIPLTIDKVCLSCFLREDTEKEMIKLSFRSVGNFPCNQLAAEFFNGGGHLNASGGEFAGKIEEALALFEKAIEKYKPQLLANG